MMLHGVSPDNTHLRNADTLDADWPTDEENVFDIVTMNPPYSAHYSASTGFLTDARFSRMAFCLRRARQTMRFFCTVSTT